MTKKELNQIVTQIVNVKVQQLVSPLITELKKQREQIRKLTEHVQRGNNNQQPQQLNASYQQPAVNQVPQSGIMAQSNDMMGNGEYENSPLLQEMLNKNYKPLLDKTKKAVDRIRTNTPIK